MDKDKLLAQSADTDSGMPEATYHVPDKGEIRVRGLSRAEVFAAQQLDSTERVERRILALGMLDPTLTEAEVRTWQRSSVAGEMEPVVELIRELSGLTDDAERSAMGRFRGEPGPDPRTPAGGRAVDDSRAAAGVDESL